MKSKKQRLIEECVDMLKLNYSDGGIASYNEYNAFVCDLVPDLPKYMTIEGLEWLKGEIDRIYENMPEFDKI